MNSVTGTERSVVLYVVTAIPEFDSRLENLTINKWRPVESDINLHF